MNKKYLIAIITVIVLLIAGGYAYYYFGPRAEALEEEQKKQAEERKQKEIESLLAKDRWVQENLVNRMPEAMEKISEGLNAVQAGDENGWQSFDEGLQILKSEIERIENAPPPPGKDLEEIHKELLGILSGITTGLEDWSTAFKAGQTDEAAAAYERASMHADKIDGLTEKVADLKNEWRYRLKQLGGNPNYYEGPDAEY